MSKELLFNKRGFSALVLLTSLTSTQLDSLSFQLTTPASLTTPRETTPFTSDLTIFNHLQFHPLVSLNTEYRKAAVLMCRLGSLLEGPNLPRCDVAWA
jgi:hypothetical protein